MRLRVRSGSRHRKEMLSRCLIQSIAKSHRVSMMTLAFGEWGGGDYARTFFDRDHLVGWNESNGFIALAAGPADYDLVGPGVSAEAEGENEFGGGEVAATAG